MAIFKLFKIQGTKKSWPKCVGLPDKLTNQGIVFQLHTLLWIAIKNLKINVYFLLETVHKTSIFSAPSLK